MGFPLPNDSLLLNKSYLKFKEAMMCNLLTSSLLKLTLVMLDYPITVSWLSSLLTVHWCPTSQHSLVRTPSNWNALTLLPCLQNFYSLDCVERMCFYAHITQLWSSNKLINMCFMIPVDFRAHITVYIENSRFGSVRVGTTVQ